MKNVQKFPQQQEQYDEASEWLAKLDRGLSSSEKGRPG